MVSEGDRHIRDRDLPGAYELIPADETTDRAIPDGDQESLVGDRGQPQHPIHGLPQVDPRQIQRLCPHLDGPHVAHHLRRLAEQHVDGHVDRLVGKQRITDDEVAAVIDRTDHGKGTALACGDALED